MTSLKKPKYCSRKWLSADTHSSGYIMYYYNEKCKNSACTNFVRIADCQNVFVLDLDGLPRKDIHRFFNNLQNLLFYKIKYFVFKEYIFQYKKWVNGSFIEIKETYRAWNKIVKQRPKIGDYKKPKCLVRLHQDSETCTEKQWQRKLEIIKNETQAFHNFLSTNKII